MDYHKRKTTVLALLLINAATPAQAIGISSMLELLDDEGKAAFVISNTDNYRQFISVTIADVAVVEGKIETTPYTANNIDQWSLSAYPARTILEPGFKKEFALKYQPKTPPDPTRDQVFKLGFVPTPYVPDGETSNVVMMAFGFAPLLIAPAKVTQPLSYNLVYDGERVTATNKGAGFFSLALDGCPTKTPKSAHKQCRTTATVLAGRVLTVTLPKGMQQRPTLRATLLSHRSQFKAEMTLTKQPPNIRGN